MLSSVVAEAFLDLLFLYYPTDLCASVLLKLHLMQRYLVVDGKALKLAFSLHIFGYNI